MGANLIEHLRQVKDFRTTDGSRHPLWLVLLLVIMGTLSGYVGYRAWGELDNQEASEMVTVQNLIAALDIQGIVLSLDALHCQKKPAS